MFLFKMYLNPVFTLVILEYLFVNRNSRKTDPFLKRKTLYQSEVVGPTFFPKKIRVFHD